MDADRQYRRRGLPGLAASSPTAHWPYITEDSECKRKGTSQGDNRTWLDAVCIKPGPQKPGNRMLLRDALREN